MKEVIFVRIEKELKAKLDMLALEENRSLNNYIVTILMEHLKQKEKETNQQFLFYVYLKFL